MPLIRILLVLRGRTAYAAHPSKRLSPGLLKGSGGSVGSARALPGLYQGSPKRPFGLRIMGTTLHLRILSSNFNSNVTRQRQTQHSSQNRLRSDRRPQNRRKDASDARLSLSLSWRFGSQWCQHIFLVAQQSRCCAPWTLKSIGRFVNSSEHDASRVPIDGCAPAPEPPFSAPTAPDSHHTRESASPVMLGEDVRGINLANARIPSSRGLSRHDCIDGSSRRNSILLGLPVRRRNTARSWAPSGCIAQPHFPTLMDSWLPSPSGPDSGPLCCSRACNGPLLVDGVLRAGMRLYESS
ncbi:hypothetical protein K432DRAFT_447630 [Lepidopterella palustris CBS 459.81]|uniref:Uncharacterized protein n=1 Tax=Lepidopterella palustris CBS 459.81 TaxID=1314670 RepID=A0A8E2J8Z0_9PEZI|nr:hypothetical protein K432DRAFT_447630 [Lepidopterella palustris CBS 459.81]